MKLVDVHCHLDGERFEKDLDEVLENAKMVGLKVIVSSGVNKESNRKVLELSKKYPIIKASFGLYPIDSIINKFENLNDDYPRKIDAFDYKEELAWIKEYKDACISIGEVGLELQVVKGHKDFEKIKEEQIKVFEASIKMALELEKPLVIHTRGGELEVLDILDRCKHGKIVLHCFGGRKSLIKRAADSGYYFSIPAVITRLQHFQTLVEMVDLKQLLTETDSPYLAPVAGERSEPKNVAITIKEIAKIKKLSEEEVTNQIWENYEEVFVNN